MRTWEEPGRNYIVQSIFKLIITCLQNDEPCVIRVTASRLFFQHIKKSFLIHYKINHEKRFSRLLKLKRSTWKKYLNLCSISSLYNLQIHDQLQCIHTCTYCLPLTFRICFSLYGEHRTSGKQHFTQCAEFMGHMVRSLTFIATPRTRGQQFLLALYLW